METENAQAVAEEAPEKEIDLTPTREILDSLPGPERRYLIPTLQKIQNVYRYLPEPAMKLLMAKLGISKAQLYGVISFYPQLLITEPGKYIFKLCYGTACFVKGANIIAEKIYETYHIHPGETDKDKIFTLQTASCLGNCGAAPMAIIGDDTHGTIDPEQTFALLKSYEDRNSEAEEVEEAAQE
jgi:NADH-quinone oxidoreductase subunit E/NADP-reducing hydrogenase subunit HndA